MFHYLNQEPIFLEKMGGGGSRWGPRRGPDRDPDRGVHILYQPL